jgi:hypothetical protein
MGSGEDGIWIWIWATMGMRFRTRDRRDGDEGLIGIEEDALNRRWAMRLIGVMGSLYA